MPTSTLGSLRGPIVDEKGNPTRDFLKWLQGLEQKTYPTLDIAGQIVDRAVIKGRTEGIGTTVKNVDSGGVVTADGVDLSRPYVNKTVDHINDGTAYVRTTPNEKTGGGRGYNALDANSKLPGESAVPGMQLNATNNATVDSLDAGATATVRVYGPSGAGTSWSRTVNNTTEGPFPSGTITGLAHATSYVVMYDQTANQFHAYTTVPDTLRNYLRYCGTIKTVASGGGTTALGTVNFSADAAPNKTILGVTVTNAGAGYVVAPAVQFNGDTTGTGAAGTALIDGAGHVTGVVITNPGSGYTGDGTMAFVGAHDGAQNGGGGTNETTGGRFANMDLA